MPFLLRVQHQKRRCLGGEKLVGNLLRAAEIGLECNVVLKVKINAKK
jgi:hypothetical protein